MTHPIKPTPEMIKDLRSRHHISRDQLADSLYGIKRTRVADWELGRRVCQPITWWAILLTWDGRDLWNEEREE